MKIALLHHSAPPIVGGVETVLAHQARTLAEAGHQVQVIAARGQATDPRIAFSAVPLADSRHPEVLAVKAELDAGRVPPGFESLRAQLVQALQALLSEVDVLIAHNVCSLNKNLALTAALHDLRAGPRLILWHHDLAWTTPRYQAELHAGYPWDLLRTAWPGVVQVVVSELRRRELAELMQLPPETVRVIPNGLDIDQLLKLEPLTQMLVSRTCLLDAAPVLLLPVRITPRKNIELALRVLAALRRTEPGAALVVTGPLGPHNPKNVDYFEQLRTLRAELGLTGAAHFLAELQDSFLADEIIADFYRLADALFLPSREEGFGLPVLEAALNRLPIFCADIAPLRALGGDQASYFAPDADPDAVAALVRQRLAADTAYQLAARTRGEYSWEHIYGRHLAPLLQEVMP